MNQRTDYFDLTEHNTFQKLLFLAFAVIGIVLVYMSFFPLAQNMLENTLNANVRLIGDSTNIARKESNGIKLNKFEQRLKSRYHTNIPDSISYYHGSNKGMKVLPSSSNWAVDMYPNTPQHARYWLSPLIIFLIPSISLGIILAFLLSSLLPKNLGFFRQKIEREIIGELDSICLRVHGYHGNDEREEIEEKLLSADLRDLHDYVILWKMSLEDLLTMNKAVIWLRATWLKSTLTFFSAFKFYMRFYVTIKYSNFILGSVYFGAAVLIIIIGLRGIKFIPANEPSLVLFALGLEFALLILFALTMMFGKEEDANSHNNYTPAKKDIFLSDDFGSHKEIESLLKMFIKKNNNE